MIVTFCGHGNALLTEEEEGAFWQVLVDIMVEYRYCTFYCGGYGQFDTYCELLLKELKSQFPMVTRVFITPYKTMTLASQVRKKEGIYDEVIYPPIEHTPTRFAIIARNHYMIDQADLVIAYVKEKRGGAYATLEYAKRKNKRIINLARWDI